MISYDTFFIGGEHVAPSGSDRIEVINPATEEVLGSCPAGAEADMDAAVHAARAAFESGPWAGATPDDRADALERLSAALAAKAMEIASLITDENGSPASWSLMGQVFSATMVIDHYAELARTVDWEFERQGALSPLRVRKAPVGVCAGIIPWNAPLFITMLKLAPALASGSTMVVKPAPDTPLDSYLLADALTEAEIPAGVVNIVAADRAASEYLVRHPGLDKVSFTGSVAAGRTIGGICGEQLKRCTLELGGKSAAIILDDVDLDAVMGELLSAGLMNNGQVCGAQTRLLISRNRYDEVVDAIGSAMAAMSVGDPQDPEIAIGPLVNASQRDRVAGYQKLGVDEGATVVVGGVGRPEGLQTGYYVKPTVFANVTNDMTIAREEIFGPVLCILGYDDLDQALEIANDTEYGLAGYVSGADMDTARSVARRIRAGSVAINHGFDMNAPFGGYKRSGNGREWGQFGFDEYLETKAALGYAPA